MSIFYYLDSAIKSPALDRTSPDDLLKEKKYLYAGINSAQAVSRFNDLNLEIANLISGAGTTVRSFNRVIESYLLTLLCTSTITNTTNDELAPHYRMTKLLTSYTQDLDPVYLDNIMYTSSKTWGTTFGTQGFFLHKGEYMDHYATPSQLANESLQYLINQSKDSINLDFLDKLSSYSLEDSKQSDSLLYKLGVDYLGLYPNIQQAYEVLSFLSNWYPRASNLILNDVRTSNFNRNFTNSNTQDAYITLVDVMKAGMSLLMDENSFLNMQFNLLHNNIPVSYFNLLSFISSAIDKSEYSSDNYISDPYQDLMKEILDFNIKRFDTNIVRLAISQLSTLMYPGGYNQLLMAIAIALLNKALILTSYQNTDQEAELTNSQVDPEESGRWYKLIYLAGYTLKKSNLYSLNVLGGNLITLSSIPSSVPSRVTDLTQ